ncbi:MAG: hypothetical protein ABEI13_00620 [Candidatus Paceibacteria bacterium]
MRTSTIIYSMLLLLLYGGMYLYIWLELWPEIQDSFISVRFTHLKNEQTIVPAERIFWYPLVSLLVALFNIGLSLAICKIKRYHWTMRQFVYHWINIATVWFAILTFGYLIGIAVENIS